LKIGKKDSTGAGYDARKTEILRVAAGIIRRKGFAATRIDDIADGVGLTKAGLYHYLPKKSQVLSAIIEHALDKLDIEVLLPGMAQKDPESRLRTLLARYARILLDEHDLILILLDEFDQLTPQERRRFMPRKREFIHLIRTTIEEIKTTGRLRDLDIGVAAVNLLAPIQWLPRWYRRSGRCNREKIIAETIEFVLFGLIHEEGNAQPTQALQ
jgi:TetR/AcrR family transcriptional regulator, cholesterol catabolism regulator